MATINSIQNDALTLKPAIREFGNVEWTLWQKVGLRIATVFFALLIIPLESEWYSKITNVSTLFDFFYVLMGYRPEFIKIDTESGKWGAASYSTLLVALAVAIVIGLLWTALVNEQKRKSYNQLYYWLSVLVRYRIAMGIIAFGFIKFYPVQMPYPALSSLNNNFGDFSGYKIYWHSVGLVPWYQVFLGVVEVLAGVLLLFRQTVFLGAFVNAVVLYNIAHANHAYDGGVHFYSALLGIFSAFLLVRYIPALYHLWYLKKAVKPNFYVPAFSVKWQQYLYRGSKYIVVFFIVIFYGYLRYDLHYNKKETKAPSTPGLANTQGFYDVSSFKLNGVEIPYNPKDSVRWHNAIFEKYSTFVYQVNKPLKVPQSNGSRQVKDVDRNYEVTGIGGGHKFYFYEADTINHRLSFYDKAAKSDARENRELSRKKKESERKPDFVLDYSIKPEANQITLTGALSNKDSVQIVLTKIHKEYPVQIFNQ